MVIFIMVFLTGLWVLAAALAAFLLRETLSPSANNIVSCLFAIVTAVYWTILNPPPNVSTGARAAARIALVLFIVAEVYIVMKYGTANPFFHW